MSISTDTDTCYGNNWEMPKSRWTKAALIDAIRECCRERDLIYDPDIEEMSKAELWDAFVREVDGRCYGMGCMPTEIYGIDEKSCEERFKHVSFTANARRSDGEKWSGESGSLNYALCDLHEFLQSVPDDESWIGKVLSDAGDEVFWIEWTPKAEMKPDPDAYRGYFSSYSGLAKQWVGPNYVDADTDFLEVGIEWKDEDGDWAERDCDTWQLPYEEDSYCGDDDQIHYSGYAYDPNDTEPYSLMEQALCRANGFAWDYEKFDLK